MSKPIVIGERKRQEGGKKRERERGEKRLKSKMLDK